MTRPLRGSISKADPLPYYAQLAEILRAGIAEGLWEPGDALPSEAELGAAYGLSRTAVRQALGELAALGLVHKEKGRGTFVTRADRARFVVQEMRGFWDEMSSQGRVVETDVLDLRVDVVPPSWAPLLEVPTGSEVVRLDRLRHADGEPLCLVRTLLPTPRFTGLLELDLSHRSLYAVLREHFGVEPRGGYRQVEATAAGDDAASLLGVKRGAPLLRLSSVTADQSGRPFEAYSAAYRADRTSFQIQIGPGPSSGEEAP